MGKRKKSSRKPTGPRKREPLETTFMCLYCNHEKSVTVKLDRKEGVAYLSCKICSQSYQSKVTRSLSIPNYAEWIVFLTSPRIGFADLTEPIDIYSEWIDAADEAEKAIR